MLNMETPYNGLHGKEATLHHLRDFGSRPFVHIETHINTSGGQTLGGQAMR